MYGASNKARELHFMRYLWFCHIHTTDRLWFLLIYISRDYPFTKCGCSTGLSTTSTRTMIFFIPLQPFLVVDSNQKGTDVTARLCKSEMSNYALYFTPKGIQILMFIYNDWIKMSD
jgi:hypothetical protein